MVYDDNILGFHIQVWCLQLRSHIMGALYNAATMGGNESNASGWCCRLSTSPTWNSRWFGPCHRGYYQEMLADVSVVLLISWSFHPSTLNYGVICTKLKVHEVSRYFSKFMRFYNGFCLSLSSNNSSLFVRFQLDIIWCEYFQSLYACYIVTTSKSHCKTCLKK